MKLWNYIFMMTGISVVMAIAGMEVPGISDLLRVIGVNISNGLINNFNIRNDLWSKLFGTEGLLTTAIATEAIGIGAFIYSKDKSFLMVGVITGVFFYWISVLVSLIQMKGGYDIFGTVLAMIGIALTVGFIQSSIDYFLGYN